MGNFVGSESPTINEKDNIELRIYEIVEKRYPEYCEKITGMLLEVDQKELKELLENQQELNNRIDQAAAVVVVNPASHLSVPAHDIGNKVFGTVQQLYPAFARQVTGMLLEIGEERLLELLNDKDQFIEHIHKAAAVVMETQVNKKATRDNKDILQETKDNSTSEAVLAEEEQEKDQLACQIYLKLVNQYPNHAEKITGMLLEMDIKELHQVNNDNGLLTERVLQAVQALGEEEKCCETKDENHESSKQLDKGMFLRLIKSELNMNTLEKQLAGLDENMQKELIGEKMYKILFNMYPDDSDIITGMLLEMDISHLLETLANPVLLLNRVVQALEALDRNR